MQPGRNPEGYKPGIESAASALAGLRGAAALAVFLYHVVALDPTLSLELGGVRLNTLLYSGWLGVYVFFALSACLLTHAFLTRREGTGLGAYLLRRVARCFPAFWLQVLLLTLAITLIGYRTLPSGWDYWSQYLMNFGAWPGRTDPLVGVWWTLPVEFSFYLILPFLVPILASRWLPWLLLASFLLTVSFRYAAVHVLTGGSVEWVVLMSGQLPGMLDVFIAGCLVPLLVNRRQRASANLCLVAGVFGVIASYLLLRMHLLEYWSGHWSYLLFPSLVGYSLMLALLGVLRGASLARWCFGHRVGVFLGDISYGLYLWHLPVISACMALSWFRGDDGAWHGWTLLVVAASISIALAWLSWRFVEQPCIAWAKARHQRAVVAEPGQS